MLKSDELLNKFDNKMASLDSIVDLEEKKAVIEELANLKNEYKNALAEEAEEIKEINNKVVEGEINMNNELLNKQQLEEVQFLNYIKGVKNELTAGANGAVIPQTVAERVVVKVFEMSPVLERMNVIHEKGDLIFVREADAVPVAYQEEMAELVAGQASFETVKLEAHLISALAKISKSLVNRAGFDVVGVVVEEMARDIARFLEGKALNGDTKIKGIDAPEKTVASITIDNLIDAMMAVPSVHQANAVFIMHPTTLATLRREKVANGLLLNPDARRAFGYELLGKEVLVSDQMPANQVIFGDLKGVTCKMTKEPQVEVLREHFATQYALGVICHVEADIKCIDNQAIVRIKAGE